MPNMQEKDGPLIPFVLFVVVEGGFDNPNLYSVRWSWPSWWRACRCILLLTASWLFSGGEMWIPEYFFVACVSYLQHFNPCRWHMDGSMVWKSNMAGCGPSFEHSLPPKQARHTLWLLFWKWLPQTLILQAATQQDMMLYRGLVAVLIQACRVQHHVNLGLFESYWCSARTLSCRMSWRQRCHHAISNGLCMFMWEPKSVNTEHIISVLIASTLSAV